MGYVPSLAPGSIPPPPRPRNYTDPGSDDYCFGYHLFSDRCKARYHVTFKTRKSPAGLNITTGCKKCAKVFSFDWKAGQDIPTNCFCSEVCLDAFLKPVDWIYRLSWFWAALTTVFILAQDLKGIL